MLKKLLLNQKIVVTDGLVAWWRVDGSLLDSFGTNDGIITVGSATYATGKVGQSFNHNNANAFRATDETAFDFEINQPFSVSVWFKTSDVGGAGATIISKNAGALGSSVGFGIFKQSTNDRMRFHIGTNTPQNNIIETPLTYNDGNWHHIIATKGATADRSAMKIYIDGSLVVTGTAQVMTGSALNNNNLGVGVRSDGTSNILAGQLDEVMIYNKELSANEVLTIYQAV